MNIYMKLFLVILGISLFWFLYRENRTDRRVKFAELRSKKRQEYFRDLISKAKRHSYDSDELLHLHELLMKEHDRHAVEGFRIRWNKGVPEELDDGVEHAINEAEQSIQRRKK